VGDPVQADLVQLHIKPANRSVTVDGFENCSELTNNIAPFVRVIFAVCDKLSGSHDLILTADVIEQLNHLNNYSVNMIVSHSNDPSQSNVALGDEQDLNPADSTDDVDATTVPTDDDVRTTRLNDDVGIDDNGRADTVTLRAEQRADPSLQLWFQLATEKKGNFFFKNGLGLLFHRERVLGHNVEQLVLPTCRIPSVLKRCNVQWSLCIQKHSAPHSFVLLLSANESPS